MTAGAGPLERELAAAAAAVAGTDREATVLLACHVGPDGDALGSMLGFGLALVRLGFRDVRASFPEPFEVPQPLRFLPGRHLLVPPTQVPRAALALSFDASSPDRLGELIGPLCAAETFLVLDHHASNQGFGSIALVDPGAAATAVIVAHLIDRLGQALDEEIATCLYTALATDTGSFTYDSTTPATLTLATRLVEAGARPAEIAREVFDTRPFVALGLLAEVLGRAELDRRAAAGHGLVSSYATIGDLDKYDQKPYVLESFMTVLRTAAEADVACLAREVTPREWSVSLRSRGATDVSRVALALGGGGHRHAAGFTGRGDVAEVFAAVRRQLDLGRASH
jgi:bifunctional oligoribonuclease and PAP phosphatase NrnA